jgi:hypothetical protein
MSNIDKIQAVVEEVEQEQNKNSLLPKRLVELDETERAELEDVFRDPSYFINWIKTSFPEFSNFAEKVLNSIRYISKNEMKVAAQQLAAKIETAAKGKKIVLLADFTGAKNQKSTWLMRELAGKGDWDLEYPQEIVLDKNSFYVFFDDVSISGGRAWIIVNQLLKRGVDSKDILIAVVGATQKAARDIPKKGVTVIQAFEIPTIAEELSAEEVEQLKVVTDRAGFMIGGEGVLTFLHQKMSDNFWPPLKRSQSEKTYLIDDYLLTPSYYSNPDEPY